MSTECTGRQSPLSTFFGATAEDSQTDDAAVVISERPFMGHLNLRGDPEDAGFMSAASSVLGFDLPTEPNTSAAEGDLLALWLGPDEWHIVTPPAAQTPLLDSLEAALDGMHVAVTDVTGGQTVLTVSGPPGPRHPVQGLPAGPPPSSLQAHPLRPDPPRKSQRHHPLRQRLATILRVDRPPQFCGVCGGMAAGRHPISDDRGRPDGRVRYSPRPSPLLRPAVRQPRRLYRNDRASPHGTPDQPPSLKRPVLNSR